jgi:hypothetical protein
LPLLLSQQVVAKAMLLHQDSGAARLSFAIHPPKGGKFRELKKDERLKGFMDTIQAKYCQHAATTAKELQTDVDLVAGTKLDATTMDREVDLKNFMEVTCVMTTDLSLMDDLTKAWYEKEQSTID